MGFFPKPVGPRAAFNDLRAFMRQRSREQVIGFALSILVTMIIVIEFLVDSKINTTPPPQIIYVDNYAPNRTDADIIADQKKDSAARDAARKARQKQFQEIENKLGM